MSSFERLPGGGYIIDGPRDKTSVDEFEKEAGIKTSIYKPTIK